MPWNSKRLTSTLLTRLAKALGLPTGGTLADTRVVLEGKLGEMGKDPCMIQVQVLEGRIDLLDADGAFYTAQEEFSSGTEEGNDEHNVEQEIGWYERELSAARAQNLELTAALQDMQAKVDAGKSRIQELWNMNCSQLVAFDSTLSAKDAEIKGWHQ